MAATQTRQRLKAAVTPHMLMSPSQVEDLRDAIDENERERNRLAAELDAALRDRDYWFSIVRAFADLDPTLFDGSTLDETRSVVTMARDAIASGDGRDRITNEVGFQAVLFSTEIAGLQHELSAHTSPDRDVEQQSLIQSIMDTCPPLGVLIRRGMPMTCHDITAEICADPTPADRQTTAGTLQRLIVAGLVEHGERHRSVPTFVATCTPAKPELLPELTPVE